MLSKSPGRVCVNQYKSCIAIILAWLAKPMNFLIRIETYLINILVNTNRSMTNVLLLKKNARHSEHKKPLVSLNFRSGRCLTDSNDLTETIANDYCNYVTL